MPCNSVAVAVMCLACTVRVRLSPESGCPHSSTYMLVLGLRVSNVSTVTRMGGPGCATQNCRDFWTCAWSSCFQNVSHHGDWGGPGRATQNCHQFWTCILYSRLKNVNSHGDRGHPGRATQKCRHFWTCVLYSRLKCVNRQEDRGVLVAQRRTVVTFGFAFGLRVSRAFTGIGGVLVAQRRNVVTFGLAFCIRVSNVSTVRRIGVVLVAQRRNCRHIWTCVLYSRFKSVNSHRDRGVRFEQRRNVGTFGLVFGLPDAKVSAVTGIGGSWSRKAVLSSLLVLPLEGGEERVKRTEERGEERREERAEGREERGGKSGER